jgi:hypothetical protein
MAPTGIVKGSAEGLRALRTYWREEFWVACIGERVTGDKKAPQVQKAQHDDSDALNIVATGHTPVATL